MAHGIVVGSWYLRIRGALPVWQEYSPAITANRHATTIVLGAIVLDKLATPISFPDDQTESCGMLLSRGKMKCEDTQ